jgi:hypothetical protein
MTAGLSRRCSSDVGEVGVFAEFFPPVEDGQIALPGGVFEDGAERS